ncbi:MAG: hypothetical protein HC769_19155 [Cyanobacteria bacterium CRU_2_1]|nr:hypothetical protein [Cyanobacteria bacterium RU_5_0]NJR60754.1 hypothetical protein [Cyanobacteria bacterium CRU_2_1]
MNQIHAMYNFVAVSLSSRGVGILPALAGRAGHPSHKRLKEVAHGVK